MLSRNNPEVRHNKSEKIFSFFAKITKLGIEILASLGYNVFIAVLCDRMQATEAATSRKEYKNNVHS